MKLKKDFITNSSSTSYIIGSIGCQQPQKLKIKLEIDISRITTTINKIEELNNVIYFLEGNTRDGFDINLLDEWEREKYLRCKEIINQGGTVYLIRASSDDDAISSFIYEQGVENAEFNLSDFFILAGT